MSAPINDGGMAFPAADAGCGRPYGGNVSLRDYFAARALTAFLKNAVLPTKEQRDIWLPKLAEASYEAADAMLQARQQ